MAEELELGIIAVAEGIAIDIKALRAADGDLTSLSTTQKGSLVAAINEIHSALGSSGAQIDDTAGNGDTAVTWSADKIFDDIEVAKAEVQNSILGGAGAAFDTLGELQAALGADANLAATLSTAIGQKVDFTTAQTLTAGQRAQACSNIGVGNPARNFLLAYTTARDA